MRIIKLAESNLRVVDLIKLAEHDTIRACTTKRAQSLFYQQQMI